MNSYQMKMASFHWKYPIISQAVIPMWEENNVNEWFRALTTYMSSLINGWAPVLVKQSNDESSLYSENSQTLVRNWPLMSEMVDNNT